SHIHFGQDLLFFPVLEDNDIPVLIGEIDLSISNERRTPYGGEHVVNPEFLTRIGIDTMEETAEVRDVDNIVPDSRSSHRPADLVEMPAQAGFRDISPFGPGDRVEMSHALP